MSLWVESDQLISYQHILWQTIRYWKTLFYHLLEIMVTNAFILHNWLRMECGKKCGIESRFRDELVLDIIKWYGDSSSRQSVQTLPSSMEALFIAKMNVLCAPGARFGGQTGDALIANFSQCCARFSEEIAIRNGTCQLAWSSEGNGRSRREEAQPKIQQQSGSQDALQEARI